MTNQILKVQIENQAEMSNQSVKDFLVKLQRPSTTTNDEFFDLDDVLQFAKSNYDLWSYASRERAEMIEIGRSGSHVWVHDVDQGCRVAMLHLEDQPNQGKCAFLTQIRYRITLGVDGENQVTMTDQGDDLQSVLEKLNESGWEIDQIDKIEKIATILYKSLHLKLSYGEFTEIDRANYKDGLPVDCHWVVMSKRYDQMFYVCDQSEFFQDFDLTEPRFGFLKIY